MMMFEQEFHSLNEHEAASVVAMLGTKRGRDEAADAADVAGGVEPDFHPGKMARIDATVPTIADPLHQVLHDPAFQLAPPAHDMSVSYEAPPQVEGPTPLPAPFFYYENFSDVADPDPLCPLTPPGRVPNFPAKMHAILARSDLKDIVAWMPHGRSWRVLKPREFESKVIPIYFDHSKFSSFVRQANGWGFRRITQGHDRNSYYHPLFLRGLPHLCKEMKRPGVSEKHSVDIDHEPDFYKISDIYPVPEKYEDDSIMLQCTIQGGPKARMPIYGATPPTSAVANAAPMPSSTSTTTATTSALPNQSFLASFQQAIAIGETQTNPTFLMPNAVAQAPVAAAEPATTVQNGVEPVPAAPQQQQQPDAATQAAAAQFAAGFAAATALSSSHLRNILGQAMAASPFQVQQPEQQKPEATPDQPQRPQHNS